MILIALFKTEKKVVLENDDTEPDFEIKKIMHILLDLLKRKSMLTLLCFKFIMLAFSAIGDDVAVIYLTNELKFPKEIYSLVLLLCFPLSLVSAAIAGYCCKRWDPFTCYYYSNLLDYFLTNCFILGFMGFFPLAGGSPTSWPNVLLYAAIYVPLTLNRYFSAVSLYAVFTKIVDRRVTSLHLTALASFSHVTGMIHKLYIFALVDWFDIYVPQLFLAFLGAWCLWFFRHRYINLKNLSLDEWKISDRFLQRDIELEQRKLVQDDEVHHNLNDSK